MTAKAAAPVNLSITESATHLEGPLSSDERAKLHECEAMVTEHQKAFFKIAQALFTIRESRLFREKYTTFEEYCRCRWGFSRQYGYRIADSGALIRSLPPDLTTIVDNENQVRALSRVVLDKRAVVLKELQRSREKLTGPLILATARKIHGAIPERIPKNTNEPMPSSDWAGMDYIFRLILQHSIEFIGRTDDDRIPALKEARGELRRKKLEIFGTKGAAQLLEALNQIAAVLPNYAFGQKLRGILQSKLKTQPSTHENSNRVNKD